MTREEVILEAEGFQMQRAYMFAITMRDDVPNTVKGYIKNIETELAKLAGVKSVFAEPAVTSELDPKPIATA